MIRRWLAGGFRLLIRAYPRPFRARFGEDLEQGVLDRMDDVWRSPGPTRAWRLIRLAADLVVSGLRERFSPAVAAGSDAGRTRDERRGGSVVSNVLQDLRFALRSLRRRPAFSVIAVLTIALGIGASTAVYTVVDGVLLEPLPFPESEELAVVWAYDTKEERGRGWMSQPDILSLQEVDVFDGVEGIVEGGATLTGADVPDRVDVVRSTGGLLTLLGVAPLMGRDIRSDDNHPDAPRVVVVSHRFWQDRLGGDPGVVGTTIELSELTWEIVGVAPADFDYPAGTDLWRAYRMVEDESCGRGCHVYRGAIARLGDGVSEQMAEGVMSTVAAGLSEAYPGTNTDKGFHLEPLIDVEVGDVRQGLWIVLGAVGLVLLIVCANTANLLLVRASARGREVAVRAAMGASRGRLLTQVLVESLVLATVGALLGLGLALGLVEALQGLAANRIPRIEEVAIDGGILLLLVGVTGLVALLFGLSPAIHLSAGKGAGLLTGGARTGGGGGQTARSVLLVVEVALSVLLLAGSGLLLRSMDQLYRVDLGFDGTNVSRFSLSLPSTRYSDLESVVDFYDRLEADVANLPGVQRVGSVYGAPLGGGNIAGTVLVEGRPEPDPGQETGASMRPVTPGYFETMGLTLLRGRGIEANDRTDTEPVAVVNETFVRENFPNEEVLGAKIRVTASFGFGAPTWTVVGVVKDVRRTMRGEPRAAVYPPLTQFGPGFMQVHVRSRPEAGSPIGGARDILARMDPNIVLRGEETIEEAKRRDTAGTRFFFILVAAFGGLAVLLAGIGLYGVVAFLVALRTREIGIRMALGARRTSVTGMVLRQGLRPTVAGIVVGIVTAAFGGRVMESLLFGVQPNDPWVLAGVAALVLLVASSATLLPARRATRVHPTEALRTE